VATSCAVQSLEYNKLPRSSSAIQLRWR